MKKKSPPKMNKGGEAFYKYTDGPQYFKKGGKVQKLSGGSYVNGVELNEQQTAEYNALSSSEQQAYLDNIQGSGGFAQRQTTGVKAVQQSNDKGLPSNTNNGTGTTNTNPQSLSDSIMGTVGKVVPLAGAIYGATQVADKFLPQEQVTDPVTGKVTTQYKGGLSKALHAGLNPLEEVGNSLKSGNYGRALADVTGVGSIMNIADKGLGTHMMDKVFGKNKDFDAEERQKMLDNQAREKAEKEKQEKIANNAAFSMSKAGWQTNLKDGGKVTMGKKEFVTEHKELKEILLNGTLADRMKEWKEQKEEVKEQTGQKLVKGGKVVGPGGPKDDKVVATKQPHSFIVPAENAEAAMKIGKDILGWKDGQKASLKEGKGAADVRLSDGEVSFTPDELMTLKQKGINVEALAPNAKAPEKDGVPLGNSNVADSNNTIPAGQSKSNTGKSQIMNPELTVGASAVMNPNVTPTIPNEKLKALFRKDGGSIPKYKKGTPKGGVEDSVQNVQDDAASMSAGTEDPGLKTIADPKAGGKRSFDASSLLTGSNIAGLAGMAGGLFQFLEGRKQLKKDVLPIRTVDPNLVARQQKADQEAKYGMDPTAKSLATSDIDATYNAARESATTPNDIRQALDATNKSKLNLAVESEKLRAEKARYANSFAPVLAQYRDKATDDAMRWFQKRQEAGADMMGAGIGNFTSAIRYMANADQAKKIDNLTK